MTVTTRLIEYDVDGNTFEGMFAVDDAASGPRPCVMVCHAWGGRKDHEEATARKLAELGYAAFAADVYGKGVRGNSVDENQALMTPLMEDRDQLQKRLRAALGTMTAQDEADAGNAATTGYCFGGLCVIDLACTNAPIKGSAAFHAVIGEIYSPEGADIEPKVIAFQGYDDPMADKDAQRKFTDFMTEKKADWQLHLFGGVSHAFTNKDANAPDMGMMYQEAADARSWDGFTSFLRDVLGA